MQPVILISEVENSLGATGYSVLQRQFGGKVERMTMLLLRDSNGWTQNVLILPADVVLGGTF